MTSASKLFRTEPQLLDEGWTREGTDWLREMDGGFERRVPLYEAKMIHHFDHRWATYISGAVDDEEGARDCTLSEKQNPAFYPMPRYWVPEAEVIMRAARVPASLKRAVREAMPERALKCFTEWLLGHFIAENRSLREDDLMRILGRNHSWRSALGAPPDRFALDTKSRASGVSMQHETPLNSRRC